MNTIRFRVGDFRFAGYSMAPAVQIEIDGTDLYHLILEADPYRSADDDPGHTGPGLRPEAVVPPSTHWLGSPSPDLSEEDLALVYDCGCGTWRCDGVLAQIRVTDEDVVWSGFRGPRHEDDYTPYSVGPFRFDRQQYEEALRQVRA